MSVGVAASDGVAGTFNLEMLCYQSISLHFSLQFLQTICSTLIFFFFPGRFIRSLGTKTINIFV